MPSSRARDLFTERMDALISATKLGILIPPGPTSTPRDPSRLLRNGLAVVSYSAFEDFFIQRTHEALSALDPVLLPFSSLPTKLREAATVGMVKTLNFRMGFEPAGTGRWQFVQDHSEYIRSTKGTGYKISPLIFAPSTSNVGESDLEASLKSLLVEAPWTKLTQFASRIGYGGIGLKETFSNLGVQRNEAAHAADADTGIAELIQLPYDLLALAISFDALFSWSVHLLLERGITNQPDRKWSIADEVMGVLFLDSKDGKIVEKIDGNKKATKIHHSLDTALQEALPKAASKKLLVVIRDERQRPVDWRTTCA